MAGKQVTKKPVKKAASTRAATKKAGAPKPTGPKSPIRKPGKKAGTIEQRVAQAIENAIEQLQVKLTAENAKPSVSDLVRLLQLKRELEGDMPKDVRVVWVDERNEGPCKDKPMNDE